MHLFQFIFRSLCTLVKHHRHAVAIDEPGEDFAALFAAINWSRTYGHAAVQPELPMYSTKSDFKVARTCGTKLYYRKLGYPSNRSDNEYLSFLADGGYMVEEVARARFPEWKGNVVWLG